KLKDSSQDKSINLIKGGDMKKLFLTSFIVMALSLALTACAPADPVGPTSKPAPMMTDSELETRIRAALNTDAQLEAVDLKVSADADKNVATISGEVWTQSMRAKAVNLAKEAIPGLVLNDKIEVKPRELTREGFTQERASEVKRK